MPLGWRTGQDGIGEQEGKDFTIALEIDDVEQSTSKLFVGTAFDKFLVREVTIVTYNTFTINGHIKQGYCTETGPEENRIEDLSSWAVLKPFCSSLIKGKELPGSSQIVLQVAPTDVEAFLGRSGSAVPAEQITRLYVNICYEGGQLTCVTRTSVDFFTLDRSLGREWDGTVRQFLRGAEIACMEK